MSVNRLKILSVIYGILSNMPLGYATSSEIQGKTDSSESEIEGVVRYFEEKGFVHVEWRSAGFLVRMTVRGVDELERLGLVPPESSARNKAVRNKLLKILYETYSKDPQSFVMSEDLVTETGFHSNDVLLAAKYLQDKGLIEAVVFGDGKFKGRISADGVDLVETGERKTIGASVEVSSKRRRLTAAQQKNYVMNAGRCLQCGEKDIRILAVHHIIPFAKGGSNEPSNLTVLCPNCHSKADRRLIEPVSLASRRRKKAKLRRSEPKDKPFLLLRFQEPVAKPIESDWSLRLLHPKKPMVKCTILWNDKPLPWWDNLEEITYERMIAVGGGGNVRIPKGWEKEDGVITVKDARRKRMTTKFSLLTHVPA